MTALTDDKRTIWRNGSALAVAVAANAVIYQGAMVQRNAAGYAVPATATAANVMMGIADSTVDNTGGANGDIDVALTRNRIVLLVNDGTNPVTIAHRMLDCYVVDDQTVSSSHAVNTRPVAGKLIDVTPEGAWVLI